MSFISYAQNLEDVILFRALKHLERGFYIDVGAQHPVIDSVTKAFYDRGWRGINIEPVSKYFQLLQQDRKEDINLEIAIRSYIGETILYDVPRTGLSTINKNYADSYTEKGYDILRQTVSCTTLDAVCDDYKVSVVHLLKIDVEGAEKEVLSGFSFQKVRPWIIVIESNEPCSTLDVSQEWESILVNNSYEYVYFDGLNRFYISKEHLELRERFNSPPNLFDEYILYSQYSTQLMLMDERLQNEKLSTILENRKREFESSTDLVQERKQKEALNKQLEDERSRNKALTSKLNEEIFQRKALKVQIDQLHHSLSWRFTAPLRTVRNRLGALKIKLFNVLKLAIKKTLRFLLRYNWILKTGRWMLKRQPAIRSRLLQMAGLSAPYVPNTPLFGINNESHIIARLPESARAIYKSLRELYKVEKNN